MVNGCQKGKAGERELAHELRRLLGLGEECRRGQQFSGLGADDVVGVPGVHPEVKRVERLNVQQAMEQVERDAGVRSVGAVPVVFHRTNHKPWLATVRLERLPELVRVLARVLGRLALEVNDGEGI